MSHHCACDCGCLASVVPDDRLRCTSCMDADCLPATEAAETPDILTCTNYSKGCRSQVAIRASEPNLAADELMEAAERQGWRVDGSGETGWALCPTCAKEAGVKE